MAVLWDAAYVLDSSVRFALGQPMYRTLPFVHPPLTFLLQAAIVRVAGRVYWHHQLYAALAGATATLLTLQLLRGLMRSRPSARLHAALLALPLSVLGVYSIFLTPFYDCDCILALLLSLWLLQRFDRAPEPSRLGGLLAGAAMVLPLFVKQNIGLPYLLIGCLGVAALALVEQLQPRSLLPRRRWLWVLLGAVVGLAVAALLLQLTCGLQSYLYWTIDFAARRRMPGLASMLEVYEFPALLWQLPLSAVGWALLRLRAPTRTLRTLTLALLAAPLLYTVALFLLQTGSDDRADSLLALWPLYLLLACAAAAIRLFRAWQRGCLELDDILPIVVLVVIHGTLLSQQLWGSTYAIWPLLMLLLAGLANDLLAGHEQTPTPALASNVVTGWVLVVSATLLFCGGFYAASGERLSYANITSGPLERSDQPALRGLVVRGPYLPDLDQLLHYTSLEIPADDVILLLPGEDPFYFASGRRPQLPFLLFDPTTDPDSPAELAELVSRKNVRWLIVKRRLQLVADPTPDPAGTLGALLPLFELQRHLDGYDVYRRRNAAPATQPH